jgi:recX family
MAAITSIISYEDKHEADIAVDGETYRITSADLVQLALEEGEIDDDLLELIVGRAVRLSCIKKAFSILSYGDISVKRLRMKLSEKFDRDISQEVAMLMSERGYIDEYAGAERFACRSADVKLWGPNRIKSELIKRGYESDAISCALNSLDEDMIYENLSELISKKMPSSGIDDIKNKSKLCAYLQRMGYSYSLINHALNAFDE